MSALLLLELTYIKYLHEVGDMNNIKELPIQREITTGKSKELHAKIDSEYTLEIYIQDITKRKEELNNPIAKASNSVVNIGFGVNGNERSITNFPLSIFNQIIKTVRTESIKYIGQYSPDFVIITSSLPSPVVTGNTFKDNEEQASVKREEGIKLDYYLACVRHMAEMLKSSGYTYSKGNGGIDGKDVIFIYKYINQKELKEKYKAHGKAIQN